MINATNHVEYIKLEKRLVLLAWLNNLFGYGNNQELLTDVKQTSEGFSPDNRSFIYYHFIGRGNKVNISDSDLERYDHNIRNHLLAINEHRHEAITLRYFQYLALLYAEIFLDLKFNNPGGLISSLNQFVQERNSHKLAADISDEPFVEADLDKLAFWMATGSGKTLIMHINYRQFLHYNKNPLDNILLITPNEGLTKQHMDEMAISNIPCERFSLEESGLGLFNQNTVRVIEITKLVEEKNGGGVSVPVEAFEGNNLILVDEGHKGSGGEKWRQYRDALGQTGFTFEYSATFGQALTASRNDKLTAEYGKTIVFDYSYRYFYGDGYGKDFYILNLREETAVDKTEMLLVGNLLSFYEQQRLFADHADELKPYNLNKPLWVFVGSSVNAIYSVEKQKKSDVLTVVSFLHHFLENTGGRAITAIKSILDGKTGLEENGEDIFKGKFQYLHRQAKSPKNIYGEILDTVFHTDTSGQLHIYDIRGKDGELGLKAGGDNDYFGLIYIGDTSEFKKLVGQEVPEISLEDDAISDSLFDSINGPDTDINLLIGAKKFMEGWNSWRVSNMGLLNIGRSEGSQIIQLFGRGVRLRGKGFSLKRSNALAGDHPKDIPLLETLNIFAVRANYMAQFRDYLEREGIETEGQVELPLSIHKNEDFLKKGLLIPRLPDDKDFVTECDLCLKPDKVVKVNVDISLKVSYTASLKDKIVTGNVAAGKEQTIPATSLDMVDWEAIYLNLIKFKKDMGFSNLILQEHQFRELLEKAEPALYHLVADTDQLKPASFAATAALQETILSILRKYIEKYYQVCRGRWESDNMVYRQLESDDKNFQDYKIRISRSEAALILAVKKLIDEGKLIYEDNAINNLPNIHFDRHLYQPLLIEKNEKIKSDPPGLNGSEQQFVNDIRNFVTLEAKKSLAAKEIFLLRNLSKGKGIGFFQDAGFFPDFILWIKEGDSQLIVFVEPHGMLLEKAYAVNDKAQLHERLAELSKEWGAKAGLTDVNLDSFIISVTPHDTLKPHYGNGDWSIKDFEEKHILFFDQKSNGAYLKPIFGITCN
jgi:hypothetical protein